MHKDGNCSWSSGRTGSLGGYSKGNINLSSATNVYVYTGGKGIAVSTTYSTGGGFNGGGNAFSHVTTVTVGSGGGASDIRIGQDSLYSRLIVAGGGGGAGHDHSGNYGYGGGVNGGNQTANSSSDRRSNGGTQTNGGAKTNTSCCTNGTFGNGGEGRAAWTSGGGGGWYGGSSCYCDYAGGGSGWVFTQANYNTWANGNSTDANQYLLKDHTEYYLTDAQTIAGNNSFTSPTGTSETGHTGNGYARITCLD